MEMLSLTETLSVFFKLLFYLIVLFLIALVLSIILRTFSITLHKIFLILSVVVDKMVAIYNNISDSRILSVASVIIISLIIISASPILVQLPGVILDLITNFFMSIFYVLAVPLLSLFGILFFLGVCWAFLSNL